jgi:hypothetical protein
MTEYSLGQFKENKPHGKGKMDYHNGDKYTGDYVDHKKTGQGVYNFANGNRYEIKCSHSLRSRCVLLTLTFLFFFRND